MPLFKSPYDILGEYRYVNLYNHACGFDFLYLYGAEKYSGGSKMEYIWYMKYYGIGGSVV